MRVKTIILEDSSRVVGFTTPTKNWSKERQEEYKLRFPITNLLLSQEYDLKGEVI